MKNLVLRIWLAALVVVLLSGCEKVLQEENEAVPSNANVVLKLSLYDDLPFDTRGTQAVTELCSRLNIGFFLNGTKVKTVAQKQGDEAFGTVGVVLEEGTYEVVVIAHNCEGSATITSTEKVTFPNNVVSDTFYYYGTLHVGTSQSTYNLELKRAVAMFRLQLSESLPTAAKKIRFYYTGGSSTFCPLTGFGNVNSRQTVMLDVVSEQQTYELYTFPHEETDELKILVSIYDEKNDILKELTFEKVPVTLNRITQYRGDLMGGASVASSNLSLTGNSEWDGSDSYAF